MTVNYGEVGVVVGFGMAAIFGIIIVAIVIHILGERAKRRGVFEGIARRLKGTYVSSGVLSHDRIECTIAGRPALVVFERSDENRSGRTTVQVRLDGPSPGTLHILREGFGEEFLKLFGAQDISIGDAEFDKVWVVKATPESLAHRVFSPDRRDRAVAAVQRLGGWDDPTIELTRDRLRVRVRSEIRSEGGVVSLVKTAQEFLEFLRGPSVSTGIELGDVKIAVEGCCPVCGTTLGTLAVRCDSCRTPHHAECWKYVGQCSTYACNGKRWSA